MYIRRKVFSRFVDESGEERLFSTTEYSYMTEEEQREFANKEDEEKKEEKKSSKLAKAAKVTGIAVGSALGAAGVYQGVHALRGANLDRKIDRAKSYGTEFNSLANKRAAMEDEFGIRAGRNIENSVKGAAKWTGDTAKKGYEKVKGAFKKNKESNPVE